MYNTKKLIFNTIIFCYIAAYSVNVRVVCNAARPTTLIITTNYGHEYLQKTN